MNEKLTWKKYKSIKKIFKRLRKVANIKSAADVSKLFTPDCDGTDKSIYFRLCSSLQNSGQMSNSIDFNGHNREIISKVVFDFDVAAVLANYRNGEELYNALIAAGIEDKGTGENAETNWEKYAQGLFDGANFLTSSYNAGYAEIRRLISLSATIGEVTEQMVQDVKKISKEIHGIGLSLTCDWLKECGCTWLVKPDTHIVRIYNHLVGLPLDNKTDEKKIIIDMFDWAQLIKKHDSSFNTYKLDRMIWLICTGNFFQCDITIGRDLIIKLVK